MYFRTTLKQSYEQYQQQIDDNSYSRTVQIKDSTRNSTYFKKTNFQKSKQLPSNTKN